MDDDTPTLTDVRAMPAAVPPAAAPAPAPREAGSARARRSRWPYPAAALLVAGLVAGALLLRSGPPPDPFNDEWVAVDTDASLLSITFSGLGDDRIVRFRDTSSSRCDGQEGTVQGIGRIVSPTRLVVTFDTYRCADGRDLRSQTWEFTHDPGTDTLRQEPKRVVWERER